MYRLFATISSAFGFNFHSHLLLRFFFHHRRRLYSARLSISRLWSVWGGEWWEKEKSEKNSTLFNFRQRATVSIGSGEDFHTLIQSCKYAAAVAYIDHFISHFSNEPCRNAEQKFIFRKFLRFFNCAACFFNFFSSFFRIFQSASRGRLHIIISADSKKKRSNNIHIDFSQIR